MPTMKALTVWQPWTSLIAIGAKPYEFRGHAMTRGQVGKRIGIHAGLRRVVRTEVENLLWILEHRQDVSGLVVDLAIPLLRGWMRGQIEFPLGAVVCTAQLGEPIRDEALAQRLGLRMAPRDSDRPEHSNWGWPMIAVEELRPPAPARGYQGLWDWVDGR